LHHVRMCMWRGLWGLRELHGRAGDDETDDARPRTPAGPVACGRRVSSMSMCFLTTVGNSYSAQLRHHIPKNYTITVIILTYCMHKVTSRTTRSPVTFRVTHNASAPRTARRIQAATRTRTNNANLPGWRRGDRMCSPLCCHRDRTVMMAEAMAAAKAVAKAAQETEVERAVAER